MITALGLALIIITSAIISEILTRNKIIPPEIARKLFHIIAGFAAAFSVKLIDDKIILMIFGSAFIVFVFLFVKYNIFRTYRRKNRRSWGIFYLPVSYTLLIIFLYPLYFEIIFVTLLIFSISDSLAALSGFFPAKSFYKLTSDKKTITGSVMFFISTSGIIFFYLGSSIEASEVPLLLQSNINLILIALAASLILTVTEAISSGGSDNLTVPIFSAVLLYSFWNSTDFGLIEQFILGVFFSMIVALISARFKFLTANGSAATFLLAAFIFGFGGWKWAIPIMTFFIISSLLSKARKKLNREVEIYFEKSGTRDYVQVLANGGIGGLLVIFNQLFPNEIIYYIYLASLSAVCADTWATEIGTMQRRVTYNILNFKKIEQGTSGGISLVGTLGAALGSFVIALSGFFWININFVSYFLLIGAAGLIGSFFDSFLGATIQAQAKCNVCDKITEREFHCGENTYHYRGYKWLNNDVVNFLAGVLSAVFILLINYIK